MNKKSKKSKPWEKRQHQRYFPLFASGTALYADSGTFYIAEVRGYLGESVALCAEIAERCNRPADEPVSRRMRPITEEDLEHHYINGYHVELVIECPALNLRHCVKLRRWDQGKGGGVKDAVAQALEFFNYRAEQMLNFFKEREMP
jgi:hypothetical protein